MPAALLVMATLVAAIPVIALFDGSLIRGIVAALTAIAMVASAWAIPGGEGRHMAKLVGRFALLLAIPAVWLAIQAAPLPFGGLAHPIWTSARDALMEPLAGRISLDPAATLIALARYLTIIGVVVVIATLAIDRRRAEIILFCLTGAGALAAVILIVRSVAHIPLGGDSNDSDIARALIGVCALGIPVSVSATGHVFERYERQRLRSEGTPERFGLAFIGCVAALAICIAELVSSASPQVLVLALFGFLIIAGIALVRRLRVSAWLTGATALVAVIAAASLVLSQPTANNNLTLRFSDAPSASVQRVETMMRDTGLAGTGGGTFAALLPIYQQAGERGESEAGAPTAAANIVVELGQPALWIIMAMALAAAAYLLRAALIRGRDSFYAAAAASAVIVVSLQAFTDPSGLEMAVGLFVAAVFGLGIAQSVSRTVQQA